MTRRRIEYWVIPPETDAEFVAHMEQVLDLYQQPYDPDCPVVCMDEQPVQLVKETRPPVAATKARPRRVDYEYERAGTASVFLFSEPLAGWRQATARARRTKADWAVEVAGLLEGRYAECPKVTLVCDNLNTHTKGAFYEVVEPVRARELVRRLEFCYTPKHGFPRARVHVKTIRPSRGRRLIVVVEQPSSAATSSSSNTSGSSSAAALAPCRCDPCLVLRASAGHSPARLARPSARAVARASAASRGKYETNRCPFRDNVFPYVRSSTPQPAKSSLIGMYSNEPSRNSGPWIPPDRAPVSIPTLSNTTCIASTGKAAMSDPAGPCLRGGRDVASTVATSAVRPDTDIQRTSNSDMFGIAVRARPPRAGLGMAGSPTSSPEPCESRGAGIFHEQRSRGIHKTEVVECDVRCAVSVRRLASTGSDAHLGEATGDLLVARIRAIHSDAQHSIVEMRASVALCRACLWLVAGRKLARVDLPTVQTRVWGSDRYNFANWRDAPGP